MSFTKLLLRSLWFYRRLNLTVVLGVALSTAILLGAMIIGDSVRFSLEQITYGRLGRTSQVITAGERLFSKKLSVPYSVSTFLRLLEFLETWHHIYQCCRCNWRTRIPSRSCRAS